MKRAVLIVVLAGILGGSALITATPFAQDAQDKRFYVTGFIRMPGSYQFIGETMTVGQGVEKAGGLTERASGEFRISRTVDGKRVEFDAMVDEPLLHNDTIVALMQR
jgi:protein involved in polysaccharide export with SLBB domain